MNIPLNFLLTPIKRPPNSITHADSLSLFWKRWPQKRVSNRKWQMIKYIWTHMLLLYYTSLRAYFYLNKLTLICFVLIPDKLLLRGQPLLSSHLPFCRGWQINKGSIAVKISSWLNCRTNNIPLQWVEVLCTDSHWKALLHLSKLFGKHGKYSCEIRQCYLFINFISYNIYFITIFNYGIYSFVPIIITIIIIIIIIIIISNGNRTEWSTIQGVIGWVISNRLST